MEESQLIIENHPFEPFIPQNATILMLGTFPPAPSRWSMEFYYPNKINDMWRIMGLIFFNDKDYFWNASASCFKLADIKEFLSSHGIALYDTGVRIRRLKGNASDKYLEIVKPIDIQQFLSATPTIRAIITAGEKASDTLSQLLGTICPKVGEMVSFNFLGREIHHYRLPSSSRAYPLSLAKKAEAYANTFSNEGFFKYKKNI